jgi:hypothetical protein
MKAIRLAIAAALVATAAACTRSITGPESAPAQHVHADNGTFGGGVGAP